MKKVVHSTRVAKGQVWHSLDSREPMRYIVVLRIEAGCATCRPAKCMCPISDRKTRIRVDRLVKHFELTGSEVV